MKNFNTPKSIAFCVGLICANGLFAHEIPGLPENHWHATDTLGYVVLGVLAALSAWALWRNGGGK